MSKGRHSSKVRFDGLDVAAMVTQLKLELLGLRIVNIYDGVSDNDAFLFKLDGDGKHILFLESGVRFHTTRHQALLQQEGMPSPLCSKLRKHLRGLRLERIVQLGNYDRVVNFVFGTGESRHSLILELYARGNLILTKSDYTILALLRSHDYDQISVNVGQTYPVTYATSTVNESRGLLSMKADEALSWAKDEVNRHATQHEGSKKKNMSSATPLKAFLLKPSSGVYHFGPSLLEHCILCSNLNPETKIGVETIENALSIEEWSRLIKSFHSEGVERINCVEKDKGPGYILYRDKEMPSVTSSPDDDKKLEGGLAHVDKILEEFQPHLLKQHEGRPCVEYGSFAEAVDDFYAHLGGQKQSLRADTAKAEAQQKLDNIRKDIRQRVETLHKEQEKLMEHAQLVELHADDVDKALSVINSALDTGMDWETLDQLVDVEQSNGNPIALLIKKLDLEQDAMILSLPNVKLSVNSSETVASVDVVVSLRESAYGNARDMFAKYRAYKAKSAKTLEASTKALKAAEETAQRRLVEAQKKSKLTTVIQASRKPQWFEKFHWFITSDNYLVLGGKDAHQNEALVKRYLRPGDAYLHADVHGAASCILRAKRHRLKNGKTILVPLSEQALKEAGDFTMCRSSAWGSKMVTSAWWVEARQVSKTAPSGEYLSVGSFMVRGKKNFLPPSQLEMGLAVLFRLGDDDSISRHKDDRRDFSLLASLHESEPDHELSISPRRADVEVHDNCGADLLKESNVHQVNLLQSDGGCKERGDDVLDDNTTLEGATVNDSIAIDRSSPGLMDTKKKAKGISIKERKLIKKYGSLDAAMKAVEERAITNGHSDVREEVPNTPSAASLENDATSEMQTQLKRGKRGKARKVARKYADQDEEDRELALIALQGGEKKFRERTKVSPEPQSEIQQLVAAQTKALLVKNSAEIAESIPEEVRAVLAECVSVQNGEKGKVVKWDEFDADVIGEQLGSLDSLDQLAAAKRLLELKMSKRIDNYSASLSGIIRTIKKFGQLQRNNCMEAGEGNLQKKKGDRGTDEDALKEFTFTDGMPDADDADEDVVDDTVEISKLTGNPVGEDSLLYAIPVCAPYHTISKFKYRVKLTPGNLKRGKAAKQCVEILLRVDGDKSSPAERDRALMKRVSENDWVQTICSDVKISAPGTYKIIKKTKASARKGAKQ